MDTEAERGSEMKSTARVEIVVFDGVEELDALGPYEVFSVARQAGADLEVRLVTYNEADRIRAAHGLVFHPQGRLDERADVVVVPGGGWSNRADRGAWQVAEEGTLPKQLARLHRRGTLILASVCTGGMLLAKAGLLQGRRAITHADAVDELAASGARVVKARVVDDDDLVSAGGVTSGIDLALHLVERLAGPEVRAASERELEYVGVQAVSRGEHVAER
jgi:transcriptional regulator GlxA family with amidase domain